jgi:tRNA threonylcarbamoyladenosine biosynthesis protein TsaE
MNDRATRPSLTVETKSAAETEALGQSLGSLLVHNLVLGLKGELGAGKTTLIRGIAAGLGLHSRVTSPTFTLINQYEDAQKSRRLFHMDTYRLGHDPAQVQAEAEMVGLSDLLDEIGDEGDEGVTLLVIEWAERIAALLPDDYLEIRLAYVNEAASPQTESPRTEQRRISFFAHGPRSAAIVNALSMPQLFYARPL